MAPTPYPPPATMHNTRLAGQSTSKSSSKRMRWSSWACLLLLLLIACAEISRHEAQAANIHRRFYRRSVRLCSRSLSDALFLLCKDRGYNEPFSSSGETEMRHTTGPGLVEECCYNSCTIEQMEQYCKPRSKGAQP